MSEAQKLKLSKAHQGVKLSSEHRARIGQGSKIAWARRKGRP
jgi:hypothetical protein